MGKMMMRFFSGLHAKLVKATGKMGGGTSDGSVLVLRHEGAKSGTVRETPLMFLNHDGGYVVVASMGGAPTNPAWYHNLLAHPDTTVTVARNTVPVQAREVAGDERSGLWDRLTKQDPRWAKYQAKTKRVIPLLALDPR